MSLGASFWGLHRAATAQAHMHKHTYTRTATHYTATCVHTGLHTCTGCKHRNVHSPHRCVSTHVHARVYAHTVTQVQARLHSHTHVATLTFTHVHTAYSTVTHVHRGAWMCACTHTSHTRARTHRLPVHEWLVGKRQEGARLPWQHILEPDQAWLVQLIWRAVSRWGLLRTPTRTRLVREQLV